MELAQTLVASPQWIAEQDPTRWLTRREQTVWDTFAAPKRRRDWLAGRLAAKRLLEEHLGITALTCEIRSDQGAPVVVGILPRPVTLSLTHSHGLAAASWARPDTQGTVGLDAQYVRPIHPRLPSRVLTVAEQAQADALSGQADDPSGVLLFWALKEAAIKARRCRWNRPLIDAVVLLDSSASVHAGAAAITIRGERTMRAHYARHEAWWLARALAPPP